MEKKTPEEILQIGLNEIGKGNTTQIQFCYRQIFKSMREFAGQETAELREENEALKKQLEELRPHSCEEGWSDKYFCKTRDGNSNLKCCR